MLDESKWSDSQLHIFGERKESVKLLKEFLWSYLCVAFRHAYVGMAKHLAHRLNRHTLFKRDERCEGMSCRMRGKGKRDTCTKP